MSFTGNTITGSSDEGIELDVFTSSTLTISGNTISGSGQRGSGGEGIQLDTMNSSTVMIDSNTLTSNLSEGLHLDNLNSSTVTIGSNTITSNLRAGLELDDIEQSSSVTVCGNTFTGNKDDGISAENVIGAQSSLEISNNTISSNDDGITTDDDIFGTLSIHNNSIQDNSGDGIFLFFGQLGSTITINANNISGNSTGLDADGSDAPVDATNNWWGAADGPGPPDGPGSGDGFVDTTSGGTTVVPFATSEVPGTSCISAPPAPSGGAPARMNVTITKAVTGDAPEGATFDFQLDCFGPDSSFSLADGESFTTSLPANTKCTLTETNNGGAISTSGEFDGLLLTGSSSFTVTNEFPVVPSVLGQAITKTLASANPASVGETVTFNVAVTFQGELRNIELLDVFDHGELSFVGASAFDITLDCQVFAGIPDASHSTVGCPLGTATETFSVQLEFSALASTLPGSTVNQASVINDQDGVGGDPPTTTGPVSANVEIIEVLALAPLGDGPVGATSAWLQGLLVAIAAALLLSVRYATHHAAPRSEG